jgi:hypothetical protein
MTKKQLERQQVVSILNEALELHRMQRIRKKISDTPNLPISAIEYEIETYNMVGDYLNENLK